MSLSQRWIGDVVPGAVPFFFTVAKGCISFRWVTDIYLHTAIYINLHPGLQSRGMRNDSTCDGYDMTHMFPFYAFSIEYGTHIYGQIRKRIFQITFCGSMFIHIEYVGCITDALFLMVGWLITWVTPSIHRTSQEDIRSRSGILCRVLNLHL